MAFLWEIWIIISLGLIRKERNIAIRTSWESSACSRWVQQVLQLPVNEVNLCGSFDASMMTGNKKRWSRRWGKRVSAVQDPLFIAPRRKPWRTPSRSERSIPQGRREVRRKIGIRDLIGEQNVLLVVESVTLSGARAQLRARML